MIRHDSSQQSGESGLPGTPGAQALEAMAAAARRAREAQEGGPPTQAVQIALDVEDLAPSLAPEPSASPRAGRRSPLEIAVWVAAALVLVAAGALAVTLGTGSGSTNPGSSGPLAVQQPHTGLPHGVPTRRHASVKTSPAAPSSSTTTVPVVSSGPPVIAGLNPPSGSAGQAIQVAGANFLSSTGQIVATFNGRVAPTSCPEQNSCSVTVPMPPSGAGTAQVVITTASGTSNTVTFTYS